jgi:hypothetical protein
MLLPNVDFLLLPPIADEVHHRFQKLAVNLQETLALVKIGVEKGGASRLVAATSEIRNFLDELTDRSGRTGSHRDVPAIEGHAHRQLDFMTGESVEGFPPKPLHGHDAPGPHPAQMVRHVRLLEPRCVN